jgi:hypothetical protein
MTNPLTEKKRANKIGKHKKTKLADSSLGPVFDLDIILISVFGLHPFTISRSSCLHWQRFHHFANAVLARLSCFLQYFDLFEKHSEPINCVVLCFE